MVAASGLPTREEVQQALSELSAITGFPIKHPVAFESITREQINRYLQDRIKEVTKPSELRAEELTLKKFGFVPHSFDLRKNTIDLLTEQAAAFYDFHRKKLFISDWAQTSMRDVALIHELAHALADQSFSLEKFTKKVEQDSEKSLARQAVVEGQAMWLTNAVIARRAGREKPKPETDDDGAEPSGKFPVFDQAPLYIRENLIFPYSAGERFQDAVYEKEHQAGLSEVFRDPPVSSQQVLHPEKYFAHTAPVIPVLPKDPKGVKRFAEGVMGELDHSVLLRQYATLDEAQDIAPKLAGSQYRLLERRKNKRIELVYVSSWSDESTAQRFFHAYRKILEGKWKKMRVASESDSVLTGEGDDGWFRVKVEGNIVRSTEGHEKPVNE
jgi:6-pyruvoyl-tetrahydropterin synthase